MPRGFVPRVLPPRTRRTTPGPPRRFHRLCGAVVSGEIRIGTQGWSYPAWVGPFYPSGTRAPAFLATYARAFRTVEVDSTFYAVPAARVVRGWAGRVPEDFVFALKVPREVTHELRLRGAGPVMDAFLDVARLLEGRLGPILVQMGPDFDASEAAVLEDFVATLPGDLRFALEVRHASWLLPGPLERLAAVLRGAGAALALSDGRWLPRGTTMGLAATPTAPFHYVRWMGPDRAITDFSRPLHDRSAELRAWAEVLRGIAARGTDVFGYVNNHFAGHSPANVRELLALLGERVVPPDELGEQTSLF
jgi:uncharacterized protein YecE (DUF72 family)